MNKEKERIGQTFKCNNGECISIIEYKNRDNVLIKFEDNEDVKWVSYSNIKAGRVAKSIDYSCRVGEERINIQGIKMKIIEYINSENITVEFDNGDIIKNKTYCNFKNGKIKSILAKTVYNIGYIGHGKYKCSKNRIPTKEYQSWIDMIRRCYSKESKKCNNSYLNCTVDEKWHNFQNFAKWYDENLWDKRFVFLDKDILYKGNKIYSEDTCIFVDNRINCLFVKSDKARGKYPIGVIKIKDKYMAKCRDGYGNNINIGYFDSEIEAFNAYKTTKENIIKKVANDYKSKYPNFPKKLYDAMYNYKVEITD